MKKKLVNYRLPIELVEAVERAAKKEGRSCTGYVTQVLKERLNDTGDEE